MRRTVCVFVAVAASALASCNTLRVAGAPTFGHVHDVALQDIEAAVRAYQVMHPQPDWLGSIEVRSHDELRIYWDREGASYTVMKRVRGKWRGEDMRVIITS